MVDPPSLVGELNDTTAFRMVLTTVLIDGAPGTVVSDVGVPAPDAVESPVGRVALSEYSRVPKEL
jgi:hypothetical protein